MDAGISFLHNYYVVLTQYSCIQTDWQPQYFANFQAYIGKRHEMSRKLFISSYDARSSLVRKSLSFFKIQ